MENKNNHQNGFGNGFVLGLLIGIVATLLITTKKGREIFRELTEKGLDRFSDLEDRLKESKDLYEEREEEDDYVPADERSVKLAENVSQKKVSMRHEDHHTHEESQSAHSPRRFFRSKKG